MNVQYISETKKRLFIVFRNKYASLLKFYLFQTGVVLP